MCNKSETYLCTVPDEVTTELAEAIVRREGAFIDSHGGKRFVCLPGNYAGNPSPLADMLLDKLEAVARKGGSFAAGLTLLLGLFAPASACAEPKPSKPVACADFRVASVDGKPLGVCYDAKKPAVWSSWAIVDVPDPETGAPRRIAVGFR